MARALNRVIAPGVETNVGQICLRNSSSQLGSGRYISETSSAVWPTKVEGTLHITMDNSESNRAICDAVQMTLNQFADSVRAGFDGLRTQLEHEQTARTLLTEQVQVLATMIQKAGRGVASEETVQQLADINRRIDTTDADARRRQQDADDRIARVDHDVQSSLLTVSRQDKVERDLKNLRTSLENFDSQAARMVSHVVEVTTSLTERFDSSVSGINQNVEERVGGFERRWRGRIGPD